MSGTRGPLCTIVKHDTGGNVGLDRWGVLVSVGNMVKPLQKSNSLREPKAEMKLDDFASVMEVSVRSLSG
jgi:hypothetical protein